MWFLRSHHLQEADSLGTVADNRAFHIEPLKPDGLPQKENAISHGWFCFSRAMLNKHWVTRQHHYLFPQHMETLPKRDFSVRLLRRWWECGQASQVSRYSLMPCEINLTTLRYNPHFFTTVGIEDAVLVVYFPLRHEAFRIIFFAMRLCFFE